MSFTHGASMRRTCLVAAGVLISTSALAQWGGRQEPGSPPGVSQRGGVEVAPPPASFTTMSIPGVVAAGTKIELVAAGLQRTEGPVAMQDGSMLVSGTNSILKVDSSDTVSTFIENSNQTNAMGWDRQGRLISVQRARGNEKIGVLHPPDKVTTLADNYQGQRFDSLNDLALDKRGGVYFTDTQGIYYLPPGGRVNRIIDEVPRPNGVVLSPDERILYVHNKDGVYMLAFNVARDGTISNRRNFARYKSVRIPGHKDPSWDEDNGADGMAVDSEGRVYAATNVGVEVFSPRGELLGVMPVQWGAENGNIRKPQNLAFGGPDRKTLYIVGAGTIYKVRTLSQGPPRPTK
jgi:gluconolactonase